MNKSKLLLCSFLCSAGVVGTYSTVIDALYLWFLYNESMLWDQIENDILTCKECLSKALLAIQELKNPEERKGQECILCFFSYYGYKMCIRSMDPIFIVLSFLSKPFNCS